MMDDDCIIIDNHQDTTTTSASSSKQSPTECNNSSLFPSKMAELLAEKVKIKTEKATVVSFPFAMYSNVLDIELLPRSLRDQQALSQLRQMGFSNNDREIMVALRAVEKKHGSSAIILSLGILVEETMMYIVAQREEQSEARKMDIAREQSEAIVAQEQTLQKCSFNDLLISAPIDDIMGKEVGARPISSGCTTNKNTSFYFQSSILLTCNQTNSRLRLILANDNTNDARRKIIHLLILEKKAFKWFGDKIPHAYFSITLPSRIERWSSNEDEKITQKTTVGDQLQTEIDDIEYAMYTLSEQQQGHLGLMIPTKFVEARASAVAKGLVEDDDDNDIIILDD